MDEMIIRLRSGKTGMAEMSIAIVTVCGRFYRLP